MHAQGLLPLLLLPLVLVAAGCATRVSAPVEVGEPVTIYLVENGKHGGLVLPTRHETVVQYDWGDWEYYAMADKSLDVIFTSLLLPTDGTLGRREIYIQPADAQEVNRLLFTDKALPLVVDRGRVDALLERLDRAFAVGRESYLYDPGLDTSFVRYETYSLVRVCNHAVVDWLKDLDCDVSGTGWTWEFAVDRHEPLVVHHPQPSRQVAKRQLADTDTQP